MAVADAGLDMFDPSDAFAAFFASGPPTGRRKRTLREELVWALATLIFPAATFTLLLFAGEGFPALGWVIPAACTVITYVLGARLGTGVGLRIMSTLACAIFSLGAALFGLLLATFPF